jgi:hypothetical protein
MINELFLEIMGSNPVRMDVKSSSFAMMFSFMGNLRLMDFENSLTIIL